MQKEINQIEKVGLREQCSNLCFEVVEVNFGGTFHCDYCGTPGKNFVVLIADNFQFYRVGFKCLNSLGIEFPKRLQPINRLMRSQIASKIIDAYLAYYISMN